jgi:hypothetical protein
MDRLLEQVSIQQVEYSFLVVAICIHNVARTVRRFITLAVDIVIRSIGPIEELVQ